MLNTLQNRLAAMRAAPTDLNRLLETVDDLREQVSTLRAERTAVLAAPRPVEQILEALDAHLDELATDAVDRLRLARLLDRRAPVRVGLPLTPGRDLAELNVNTGAAMSNLFGLLIVAARQPLRDLIADQVADLMAHREPLTDQQIEARVAEIDDALLVAELSEEGSTRLLERAGIFVDRRGDASPLAVLAADAALPT